MQAKSITASFRSVYAIEPAGDVSVIERGPDGLWGRWRGTAVQANQLSAGGTVLGRIGLDGKISAFERGIWQPPQIWTRQADELLALHVPGMGPVLLAVEGGVVWSTWKEAATAPWHDWVPLDGRMTGLDVALVQGRGLEIVGLRDGEVHCAAPTRPTAAWGAWRPLGTPGGEIRSVRAQAISGGGLAIFALGADGAVHHRWQDDPAGAWRDWESLGAELRQISVTKAPSGGLALFGIGLDDAVRCRVQARPFGTWSSWIRLHGRARRIVAQTSYTDGLEVFAVGLDDEVYHTWCERVDAPWTVWTALDYELSPLHGSVARAML